MGAAVMQTLANAPANAQAAQNANQAAQAQLPGLQAQSQLAQLQTEEAQRSLRDQQILGDAIRQNNGNFGKAIMTAIQDPRGMSGAGVLASLNQNMAMQKSYADLAKTDSETGSKNVETLGKYNDLAGSALEGWHSLPADQQAAAWPTVAQKLKQYGFTGYDPSRPLDENGYDLAQGLHNYHGTLLSQAKTQAETNEAAGNAAEAQANADKSQRQQDLQDLSGASISSQQDLDQFRADHPKLRGSLPATFNPYGQTVIQGLIRSAVPVEKQPDFDIEAKQAAAMKNMKPADWDTQVDAAIDPKQFADINTSTKALVQSAIANGAKMSTVQALIKDGTDKAIGRNTSVVTAKNTAPFKIQVAAGEAGARAQAGLTAAGLTDDDFARLGQQYHDTGIMPQVGMGNGAVRGRIMHESNQIAAQKGESPADVTAQQTIYQTGKLDLASQQKLYSQVKGFEDTAGQNLDRALKAAGSVIDSGSPLFNAPLRGVAGKLGGTQQAAFNAAITTAQNEVARVLNSATASGGVVSDHAKDEVKQMLSGDYSLAQLQSAANILRQDMHTRTDTIQQQIQEQQKRMLPGQTKTPAGATYNQGGGNQSQDGGAPTYKQTATGPNGHKIGSNDGNTWYDVQTGQVIK